MGLVLCWLAAPAQAAATDSLIEGAKLCTRHLPRYEREYGIPTHLLSAIASTESGRYHEGLKLNLPWPWTINADGKGYYYNSKQEAIAAARKFQARGQKSIDVGCMQVNLYHHPRAFSSLDQAFEPENNIAYAAGFLRGLYQNEGSWKKAAADYHSKAPVRGNQYVGRVYDSWYRIIDKLRMARLQVPSATLAALNETAPAASARQPARLPEQAGKKVAAYHTPRMNSIGLSKRKNSREHGVIVVRPDIAASAAKAIPVTVSSASTPAVLRLAEAKTAAVAIPAAQLSPSAGGKKPGPRFIFND